MCDISPTNLKRILDENYKHYKIIHSNNNNKNEINNQIDSVLTLKTRSEISNLALTHLMKKKPYVKLSLLSNTETNIKMITRSSLRKRYNKDNTQRTSENTIKKRCLRRKTKLKAIKTNNKNIDKSPSSSSEKQSVNNNNSDNSIKEKIINDNKYEHLSQISSLNENLVKNNSTDDVEKVGKVTSKTDNSNKERKISQNGSDIVTSTVSSQNINLENDNNSQLRSLLLKSSSSPTSSSIVSIQPQSEYTSSNSELNIELKLPKCSNDYGKFKISIDLSKFDFSTPTRSECIIIPTKNSALTEQILTIQSEKQTRKRGRRKANNNNYSENKKQRKEKSELVKFIENFGNDCNNSGSLVTSSENDNNNILITDNSVSQILTTESTSTVIEQTILDNSQEQLENSPVQVFLTNLEGDEWIRTTKDNTTHIVSSVPVSSTEVENNTDSTVILTSVPNNTTNNDNFVLPADIEADAMRLVEFIENYDNIQLENSSNLNILLPKNDSSMENHTGCENSIKENENSTENNNQNLSASEEFLSCTLTQNKTTTETEHYLIVNNMNTIDDSNQIERNTEKQISPRTRITLDEYRKRRLTTESIDPIVKGKDMPLLDEIPMNVNETNKENSSEVSNINPEIDKTVTSSAGMTIIDGGTFNNEKTTNNEEINNEKSVNNEEIIVQEKSTNINENENEDSERDEDVLSLFAYSPLGSTILDYSEYDTDVIEFENNTNSLIEQFNDLIDIHKSEKENTTKTDERKQQQSSKSILKMQTQSNENSNKISEIQIPFSKVDLDLSETLKNFKIPKRNNSSDKLKITSTATTSNNVECLTTSLSSDDVITYDQQKQSVLSLSSSNSPSISLFNSTITATTTNLGGRIFDDEKSPLFQRNIISLFGNLCFAYINDSCNIIPCKYSHNLIDIKLLKNRLIHLNQNALDSAYKFTWRNIKLFDKYFSIFCEIYGDNKQQLKLLQMITDCFIYTSGYKFLKDLQNALIKTNLTQIDAIRQIIIRSPITTINDTSSSLSISLIEIINEIVIMITESDPLKFLDILEFYSNLNNYNFQINAIMKLTEICNHTKNSELMRIVLKILMKIPKEVLMDHKNDEILNFLLMVQGCSGEM